MEYCWQRIGIAGDRSCKELTVHVHCRNCPSYANAAHTRLARPAPSGYREHRSAQLAAPAVGPANNQLRAVLAFRIAAECLALPVHCITEVVEDRDIHPLPHRRNGALQGLCNVRGELLPCLALARLLTLQTGAVAPARLARLLILNAEQGRLACRVDEVLGVLRHADADLQALPVHLAHSPAPFAQGLLSWRQISIGLLDPAILLTRMHEALA
ncbi:chemotaxis protein CheW [Paucibacter soli]|uniref:chemotaxis protein CheW n=1 Tax=Paucibacter soli TaxID=3133433 RepID=UPI0030AD3FFC